MAVNPQSNGFGNFESTAPEKKPPLPPKTKPSASTFFVASSELSEVEKDLLSDYGLSSSPLFRKSTSSSNSSGCASNENSPGQKPVDLLEDKGTTVGPPPRLKQKVTRAQPTWQKFT